MSCGQGSVLVGRACECETLDPRLDPQHNTFISLMKYIFLRKNKSRIALMNPPRGCTHHPSSTTNNSQLCLLLLFPLPYNFNLGFFLLIYYPWFRFFFLLLFFSFQRWSQREERYHRTVSLHHPQNFLQWYYHVVSQLPTW